MKFYFSTFKNLGILTFFSWFYILFLIWVFVLVESQSPLHLICSLLSETHIVLTFTLFSSSQYCLRRIHGLFYLPKVNESFFLCVNVILLCGFVSVKECEKQGHILGLSNCKSTYRYYFTGHIIKAHKTECEASRDIECMDSIVI